MSVTTSTPQTICNSPLNLSTAKMLYTIPKAKREGMETKSLCGQAFYELPPVKENRSTSFGYGHKYDFTKNAGSNPAPNTYSQKSELDGTNKKKGYSFGLSRDQMAVTGGFFVGDKNSPGPGSYDTRESNKTTFSYSFKGRTPSTETHNTNKIVPGPGAYPALETISPSGKQFVSKYHSASTTVFSPAKGPRFGGAKEAQRPGPGAYDSIDQLNNSGSYHGSKMRSSLGKTFGLSLKGSTSTEKFKQNTPGPGSYSYPSDFGHYASKSSVVQHTVA